MSEKRTKAIHELAAAGSTSLFSCVDVTTTSVVLHPVYGARILTHDL